MGEIRVFRQLFQTWPKQYSDVCLSSLQPGPAGPAIQSLQLVKCPSIDTFINSLGDGSHRIVAGRRSWRSLVWKSFQIKQKSIFLDTPEASAMADYDAVCQKKPKYASYALEAPFLFFSKRPRVVVNAVGQVWCNVVWSQPNVRYADTCLPTCSMHPVYSVSCWSLMSRHATGEC